ncbi:MAG: methylmalonyl-CoA epimerase [Anaerolineaceae bacterium]|nr:methylmalonyl-CoA epimerase [Anaerolineaceae bacterium]
MSVKKVHHIAIAVPDMETALHFWCDTLGLDLSHTEEVPSQKAIVAFLPAGESEIELVQPTQEDTGTARFIQERGGGIHHICLEVDDLASSLVDLKAKGVRLINEAPVLLEGRKMAFVHPKSAGGVLIELYEVTD